MIRHMVFWKFREGTEKEQEQFLSGLAGLYGVIPELKRCSVLRDALGGENCDAALIADFESMEALNTYKNDPRHKEVSALCKSIRISRYAVDAEIGAK